MQATTLKTIFLSNHSIAEIFLQPENNHHLLISTRSFEKGDTISKFSASEVHNHPSRYTVQVKKDKHIILSPEFLQYINHSCNPNVFFNTTSMELVALQSIAPGDEFTFFYPSTEWDMADPFHCLCGSVQCLGIIKGAKHISDDVLNNYELTDFIQSKRMQLKD
jgi:hypothetical protein